MDESSVVQIATVSIAAGTVLVGLNAWRREYVGRRRIELAEEVLAMFYEARDAIAEIRHPFSHAGEGTTRAASPEESPEEKSINDNAYVVWERYLKRQDLFNRLYSVRYRYGARFGEDKAKPFTEMRRVVNEILVAANTLSRL